MNKVIDFLEKREEKAFSDFINISEDLCEELEQLEYKSEIEKKFLYAYDSWIEASSDLFEKMNNKSKGKDDVKWDVKILWQGLMRKLKMLKS